MKNKNLVLLALAIGCGLVAAFLTAKLSAGGKTEMVPVLVAAKNLDQGTKLDNPEQLFVRKPFPRESVPPEFIDDVSQLKGKTLQRTVRPGTHVTIEDVTPVAAVTLPVDKGVMYKAMAIKVQQHSIVGGLVRPGSRVDVVAVDRYTNGKTAATLILQKVLVVAVNDTVKTPEGEPNFKNATTVTLAVTQKEGQLLALAGSRGELSLMLRSPDDMTVSKSPKPVAGLDDTRDDSSNGAKGDVEMSKVVVAKKTVPAGTRLENPGDFFDVKEVPGEAPENSFTNLDELKGKVVTRDVFANQMLPKEAFDGAAPTPGVGIAKNGGNVQTHTMIIQVGTSNPQYAHYDKNGRLMDGSRSVVAGGTPAGDPRDIKPEPKPEGKPEEKPEDNNNG